MVEDNHTLTFEVARWDLEVVCHELSASTRQFPLAWSVLKAARAEARGLRGTPVRITLTQDSATRLMDWIDEHASHLTAHRFAKEASCRVLDWSTCSTGALSVRKSNDVGQDRQMPGPQVRRPTTAWTRSPENWSATGLRTFDPQRSTRSSGSTRSPKSVTVRTGSAARLTVNMSCVAPAASAARTWPMQSSGVPAIANRARR
jgi:hypothetical protein